MNRWAPGQHVNPIETVTTASLPHQRKEEVWRAAIQRICEAGQVVTDKALFSEGTILTFRLSGTRISMITADPHAVVHNGAGFGRSTGAVYVCSPLTGGATLSQDGIETEVRARQVAAFDSTRPFRLIMRERTRMVLVGMAHRTIGVNPGHTGALTASPWDGTSGVGAVASAVLATVGTHLSEFDAAAIDPMGNSIRSMIMSLFAERLSRAAANSPGARQMLMIRVQTFAREHLHDVSLDPATLAQRHNVSLRYLQMLFAEHGTSPAKWIRDERLARCHEDLRNPRHDHLTIAAIGERWALYGAPQLSRLFRDRYGCPPSDIRKRRSLAVTAV